jgi:L-ascorbate metabolism protein UlaG (beta-lactamase superfamily)
LLDPWLVGDLTFGGQQWFFQGTLTPPVNAATLAVDLILLSQGLPDHAHEPTLKQLDSAIPVVGSATAAQVAQRLGYSQVTALKPGEKYTGLGQLDIEAVAGAAVPQIENGYVLTLKETHKETQKETQQRIYYEPHGFFEETIDRFAPVDVLITPVVNLELPLVGPIIRGCVAAPELARRLRPRYILPTATGGDVSFTGVLMGLLKNRGTLGEFTALLQSQNNPALVQSLGAGESVVY